MSVPDLAPDDDDDSLPINDIVYLSGDWFAMCALDYKNKSDIQDLCYTL